MAASNGEKMQFPSGPKTAEQKIEHTKKLDRHFLSNTKIPFDPENIPIPTLEPEDMALIKKNIEYYQQVVTRMIQQKPHLSKMVRPCTIFNSVMQECLNHNLYLTDELRQQGFNSYEAKDELIRIYTAHLDEDFKEAELCRIEDRIEETVDFVYNRQTAFQTCRSLNRNQVCFKSLWGWDCSYYEASIAKNKNLLQPWERTVANLEKVHDFYKSRIKLRYLIGFYELLISLEVYHGLKPGDSMEPIFLPVRTLGVYLKAMFPELGSGQKLARNALQFCLDHQIIEIGRKGHASADPEQRVAQGYYRKIPYVFCTLLEQKF